MRGALIDPPAAVSTATEEKRTQYRASAATAATGIFVGSTIVATRFVIGFCCLLPPALLARRVPFARRDLLALALLGITQFGILIVLLNYALQTIPSARAALLFATMPLITLLDN